MRKIISCSLAIIVGTLFSNSILAQEKKLIPPHPPYPPEMTAKVPKNPIPPPPPPKISEIPKPPSPPPRAPKKKGFA